MADCLMNSASSSLSLDVDNRSIEDGCTTTEEICAEPEDDF